MTEDRDVRLSEAELSAVAEALYRRGRELKRSIAKDSGTYHRALLAKERELEANASAHTAVTVALEAINRRRVDIVRAKLARSGGWE